MLVDCSNLWLTVTPCYLNCGWIDADLNYGIDLLEDRELEYDLALFPNTNP